jgi:hypothetical protein
LFNNDTKTAALNLPPVLEDPSLTGAEFAIHPPFIATRTSPRSVMVPDTIGPPVHPQGADGPLHFGN